MKEALAKTASDLVPFNKRMATIVFETNVPHKGSTKASINVAGFSLSAGDLGVYTRLLDHFFRDGEPIVSKSAQDIAAIMPTDEFVAAVPRLIRARALSVTFWEHRASAPKLWRRVDGF